MSSVRWSQADLDSHNAKQKRLVDGVAAIVEERKQSKYRNKVTLVDGIEFMSKREARRYVELKNMQMSGQIFDLKLQVPVVCAINGIDCFTWIADFVYFIKGNPGWLVYEDCKGFKTDIYRLKKKVVESLHGIRILET